VSSVATVPAAITVGLQTQANHLVSADLAKIYQKEPRHFEQLGRILHTSRQAMLSPPPKDNTPTSWTHDSATAANLLLQFQLFDLYADALGYPANPARPTYYKVPATVDLPHNLTKVWTWSSIHICQCHSNTLLASG
jgi:hypothetical protein